MPKQKSYTSKKPNKNGHFMHIDKQKLDEKIRKISAPASQPHKSKKAYSRKVKYKNSD